MADKSIRIQAFPNDDQLWRVQWFGQLSLNPNISDEPRIEVVLIPVTLHPDCLPTAPPTFHKDKSSIVEIGVGQLPLVHIGSVWLNGELQPTIAYKLKKKTFTSLEVIPGKMTLAKTSHCVDGEYLLPYQQHFYGRGNGVKSRCLFIENNQDPYHLIIPVVEIIRFYYATSTKLARIMFNGKFAESSDVLYNPQYTSLRDGLATVTLRKEFSDDHAAIAGRFAFSKVAMSNAAAIHESIIRNLNSGDRLAFPEVFPPFEGTTDLTVYGKYIHSQGKFRFLVFWIDSCTAPFPFENFRPGRDNDNRKGAVDKPDREVSGLSSIPVVVNGSPEVLNLEDDEEPDSRAEEVNIILNKDHFCYLSGRELPKAEKEECEFRAGDKPPFVIKRNPDKFSTGGGVSGSGAGGVTIDIVPFDPELPLPATLENFIKALEYLCSDKETITYRVIPAFTETIRNKHGRASLFPVKANGQRLPFSYIKWRPAEARARRQVMVAEITYYDRFLYFMEIERRSSETFTLLFAHCTTFKKMEESTLEDILTKCAVNNGTWIRDNEVLGVERKKIKHTWESVEELAERMILLIEE